MSDWLTYEAAAQRFGISAEAVRQLAMRRKWPRRKPNDDPFGRVQVLIPSDAEIRPRTAVQHPSEHPLDTRPTPELDTLRDALDRERKRADAAEKRVDAADQDRRQAHARADAADADRRSAEARAEALKAELTGAWEAVEQARREAQDAQDRAEELRRADEARKIRRRWARLRAAWRGE